MAKDRRQGHRMEKLPLQWQVQLRRKPFSTSCVTPLGGPSDIMSRKVFLRLAHIVSSSLIGFTQGLALCRPSCFAYTQECARSRHRRQWYNFPLSLRGGGLLYSGQLILHLNFSMHVIKGQSLLFFQSKICRPG